MTTHRIPGLILTDHEFTVPLNYENPGGTQIKVFAREVSKPGKEHSDLPWLVFLQGGPGSGAPRPENGNGWLGRAIQDYRVLLLDQRGTGRSTPVLCQTLQQLGSPVEQAEYLKFFRADAIVRDAELIRRKLLGENTRWSVLGQSFGGFCAVHYLSASPEGLQEVIITGGLPPLTNHPDEIYRITYQQVIHKNQQFYERYPEDIKLVTEIANFLHSNDVRLLNGDRYSARRFQQLGLGFGASNGFEQLHYLIEQAFVDGISGKEISFTFLRYAESSLPFETNPIFAILHEAIYCQEFASNWSADRVKAEFPVFDISSEKPLYFTGEMIYPWMFEEYSQLIPLQQAANYLAEYDGWPVLYDLPKLNANQVPCVAAVYFDDMYVAREYSEQTAKEIEGMRLWVTNEYQHSGLRLHGDQILDHLLRMLHGEL